MKPSSGPALTLVVAGVELLEVLAALSLGPRQGDLDDLAHLRRPAAQRLDELAKRQAACGLRLKSVLMNVLHGARILAAVRRALTPWRPRSWSPRAAADTGCRVRRGQA